MKKRKNHVRSSSKNSQKSKKNSSFS